MPKLLNSFREFLLNFETLGFDKTKAASASLFCLLVSCKDYSKERLMINGLFPRLLAFTVWLQWHNYKRQGVCTLH